MADIKKTPQRNNPGATRGAVPPKKSTVVRVVDNRTGEVVYTKTPNSAEARAKLRADRNQAVKAIKNVTPQSSTPAVKSTSGRSLGGQAKSIKAKPPSGVTNIKRGAQELVVTRSQGIRSTGGVPAKTIPGVSPKGQLVNSKQAKPPTPVKATPVKATPVKATPVKATPVKATPTASKPASKLMSVPGRGAAIKGALGSALSAATNTSLLIDASQELKGVLERAGFKSPKGSRSQAEIAGSHPPQRKSSGTGSTGTRSGRTGRGGTTYDVGGNPAKDGRYVPGSQQVRWQEPAAPARRSPASAAPVHASPQSFGSAQRLQQPAASPYVGSSIATPARPSAPVPAASETYRDGGKGLYQGSEEYRKAVGGSGNPLLNRLRKDLGRDLKTGERANNRAQSPAEYNVSEEEGLRRLGQLSPTAAALSAQYAGNDEPGRLGQADDPLAAIAEALQMVSQAPSKKTLKIAKPKRRNERF